MIVNEDYCVDCGECVGQSCPYYSPTPTHYCDNDCDEFAEYEIDGMELCHDCALDYLKERFDEYTVLEMCDLMGIDYHKIGE